MRAFLGVALPDERRRALAPLQAQLAAAGARPRWVPEENLHVTLRFLGEIDHERAEAMGNALAPVFAERSAPRLEIAGVGAFPDARRPRIVYAGLRDPDNTLTAIAAACEAAARDVGLAPEERTFVPHITLARLREGDDASPVRDALATHAHTEFGGFTARAVTLFESRLGADGARYTALREIPFDAHAVPD